MIKETAQSLILLFREKIEQNTVMAQGNITEIKTVPAIVLTGATLREVRNMRSQARIVEIDHETLTYAAESAPRWYDMRFGVTISAATMRDLYDTLEKLSRVAQTQPLLTATQGETGRERQYYWEWAQFPSNSAIPNASGVYEAEGELIIHAVEVYAGDTSTGVIVSQLVLELGIEPRLTGRTITEGVEAGEPAPEKPKDPEEEQKEEGGEASGEGS